MAVKTKGEGSVSHEGSGNTRQMQRLSRESSRNTRQRQCLSREGGGNTRQRQCLTRRYDCLGADTPRSASALQRSAAAACKTTPPRDYFHRRCERKRRHAWNAFACVDAEREREEAWRLSPPDVVQKVQLLDCPQRSLRLSRPTDHHHRLLGLQRHRRRPVPRRCLDCGQRNSRSARPREGHSPKRAAATDDNNKNDNDNNHDNGRGVGLASSATGSQPECPGRSISHESQMCPPSSQPRFGPSHLWAALPLIC